MSRKREFMFKGRSKERGIGNAAIIWGCRTLQRTTDIIRYSTKYFDFIDGKYILLN